MTVTRTVPRHRAEGRTITPLAGVADTLQQTGVSSRAVFASVTGLAVAAGTLVGAGAGAASAADLTVQPNEDEFASSLQEADNSGTVVSLDVEWESGDSVSVSAVAPEAEEATTVSEDLTVATADTTTVVSQATQTTESTETTTAERSVDTSSVVSAALSYVGVPYVYGGSSPSGFDCSGFTQYVYSLFGISLPRTANAQGYAGTFISASEAQPGDLVWHSYGHVGIYIGNGQVVEATTPGSTVKVNNLWGNYSFVRVS